MTRDEALRLLGVEAEADGSALRAAYDRRKREFEERAAAAPTEALREKYARALKALDAAHTLLTARPSASASLSATQLGDLPQAAPSYTQHDSRSGAGSSQTMFAPGMVLAERYEVRRLLGTGGMGAVYEAHDQLKHENVAVKVLLPHLLTSETARERFLTEAKLACRLSHANIVRVFDVGSSPPYFFLTMELLEGQTLRQKIEAMRIARQPFTVAEVQAIAQALSDALTYAHRSLVHRDLKPENVWLTEEGEVKLMDFGVARAFSATELTKTGLALGTAYYMAPEQLTGAREVDWRADQYSLAVMLYELLTGQIPQGAIQPPRELRPDIPAGLSAAVMKALNPRPERRFASLADLLNAMSSKGLWVGGGMGSSLLRAGGVVAGFAVVVALIALAAPLARDLLPDREAAERARTEAVQAQAAIGELLRRVDIQSRRFDDNVRETRNAADRLADRVRQARGDEERQALTVDLARARQQAQNALLAQRLVNEVIIPSSRLIELRASQASGEASLRDGRTGEAAETLRPVRADLESILAALELLPRYLDALEASQTTRLRYAELVAQTGGSNEDADRALERIARSATDSAESGNIEAAIRLAQELESAIRSAATEYLEQQISAQANRAQQEMGAGRLRAAETALETAKTLRDRLADF